MRRTAPFAAFATLAAPLLLVATPARAAVQAPACPAIAAYVAGVDLKPVTYIGDDRSLGLATAVTTPEFTRLFGAPPLEWTAEDAKSVAQATGECARALGRARQRDASRAVGYFAREIAQIGNVRNQLDRIHQGFDRDFKALLDAKPDRDQLAALMILDHARAGGEAVKEANSYARQITDNNDSKQIHGDAARGLNQLLADLMRAPARLGDRMYPALTERRDALVPQVAAQQIARIDAAPATLQGLQSLPRLREDIDKEVRLVLPAPAYKSVADHFATRDAAIQEAVQAQIVADIGKVPAGGQGLAVLDQIDHAPILAALAPPRVAAIHAAVASRRDAMQDAMANATIKEVAQFPATLDGLAQLRAFAQQVNANMAQLAGPARAGRVNDAIRARATAIATAALPGFNQELAAMPLTRPGLLAANSAAQKLNNVLALMQPAQAEQYKSALVARHDAIQAAVAAEDAKLEALPLTGATYAGIGGHSTLEFRNATHAYLAIDQDNKLDITYETDGKNVILHGLPRGSIVFERHGAMLVGGGLHMVRKME